MERGAVRISNLILSLAVIAASVYAILHVRDLVDFYRLQTFQPSSDIAVLAHNTTMTERAKNLFYASHPTLEDKNSFNRNCPDAGEQSIVLGCYRAQNIYLFNITDARLHGVKEVTAAHEMLHAVYERFNEADKRRVNALLDPQIKAITDQRILGLIDLYNKQEPGELYNEMHSILATEYRDLSPALEDYYKTYFSDRKKIVAYSEKYEAVFSASKNRITTLDAQLEALKKQVDTNNTILEREQAHLEAEATRMQSLRRTNIDAYNQAVPDYNARAGTFNALVAETRQLVDQYNSLVEERNREVGAQADLYQNLDSRYQAVPQN